MCILANQVLSIYLNPLHTELNFSPQPYTHYYCQQCRLIVFQTMRIPTLVAGLSRPVNIQLTQHNNPQQFTNPRNNTDTTSLPLQHRQREEVLPILPSEYIIPSNNTSNQASFLLSHFFLLWTSKYVTTGLFRNAIFRVLGLPNIEIKIFLLKDFFI